MRRVLVVGSRGALGTVTCDAFESKGWQVWGLDVVGETSVASRYLAWSPDSHDEVVEVLQKTPGHESLDAIVHTAGGWKHTSIESNGFVSDCLALWNMNAQSVLLATHLAYTLLKPRKGVLAITGAQAALEPPNSNLAYTVCPYS